MPVRIFDDDDDQATYKACFTPSTNCRVCLFIWAHHAGVYKFTFGTDGSQVKGRYSFIYVYEDGQWKISHHHSSQMPGDTVRKT